jgi:predicted nucleic acid-binding protein
MSTDAPTDVITDTSTLVNFLRIGRVDLLAGLTSYRFVVTDHVRYEVASFYPAQLSNFEFAHLAGHVVEITLDTPADRTVFAELKALRLGDGECASIAAALNRGFPLAIDDIRARKKAVARDPSLRLLDTIGLMVEAIQAGLLTVAEADTIKVDWETNHRFIKKHFSSFAELIP